MLALDDVQSLAKRKTVNLFNTAIAVITKDDKEIVFKSFRKRGECIEALTRQLQALGRFLSDDTLGSEDSEHSTAGGEEPTESIAIPSKSARASSSMGNIPPSKVNSRSLKHASAPSNKKKRRKSDEPPTVVALLDPSAGMDSFSTSLPRDMSPIMAMAEEEGESSDDSIQHAQVFFCKFFFLFFFLFLPSLLDAQM